MCLVFAMRLVGTLGILRGTGGGGLHAGKRRARDDFHGGGSERRKRVKEKKTEESVRPKGWQGRIEES